jgi:hypothetical protein
MDVIAAVIAIIAGMLAFDLAAVRWGADSRPSLGDDHHR